MLTEQRILLGVALFAAVILMLTGIQRSNASHPAAGEAPPIRSQGSASAPVEQPDQGQADDEIKNPPDDQRTAADRPYLADTVETSGTQTGTVGTVTNPDSLLVVVNKKRRLPASYSPAELVVPDVPFTFEEDLPKKRLRPEAADALEALFEAAEEAGMTLYAVSGFRSYETQQALFEYNVRQAGSAKDVNRTMAKPGESEHQTGLSMDVSTAEMNGRLDQAFANTDAGRWLAEHAPEFGFIIRYPKGKTPVTGYAYEPWHLRYVGRKHAQAISQKNLTLEEYLTR